MGNGRELARRMLGPEDPFDPKPKQPRSVSQYNQFRKCPYSWYLARVKRAWQRPAAWLPQGSAEHTVFEAVARSGFTMPLEEAQALFGVEYAKEVAGYTEITPNFEWWSRSGPYNAKRDLPRRYQLGLEQIERFYAWQEKAPDEVIWIAPDGTPGIELGFDIDLDGVQVRGFIDAVVEVDGELVVRDYKSGNQPGDDFQLGVYAVAIEETYGVPAPKVGDYWMGRAGKPTYPYDLTDWTRERVAEEFHELEANIQAENFDPKPTVDGCRFCDVSDACAYRLA